MSRMSDHHASTAAERADEAEREVQELTQENTELFLTLEGIEIILSQGCSIDPGGHLHRLIRETVRKHKV